jgi:hypothetical protein
MSRSIVHTDIPFGSVYAYRRGDAIEDDAVKQNKWEDYVAKAGTKAAREALGLPEEDKTETAAPASEKGK